MAGGSQAAADPWTGAQKDPWEGSELGLALCHSAALGSGEELNVELNANGQ